MIFSAEQKAIIELASGFPPRLREDTNEDDERANPPPGREDGDEDYESCAEEDGETETENNDDDEVSEYMDEEESEIEGDHEVDIDTDEDGPDDRDVTNENSESEDSYEDCNAKYEDDEDEDDSEADVDINEDNENRGVQKMKIIRVTAAAGSGKSTTLIGFSERLIQMGHTNITYLTFSKTLAEDAAHRMDESVTCRTIHSAALAELDLPEPVNVVDEDELDAYILEEYQDSINEFLSTVHLTPKQFKDKDPLLKYRKQVACYIQRTLTRFLRSSDALADGFDPDRKYPSCTYYPAIKWHSSGKVPGLPRNYGDFHVKHAKRLFEDIRDGSAGNITFDMMVKEAQLQNVKFPCDALLVDETQDCTQCQIELVTKQKDFGTQVVLVGDAAQTIFSFRGVKSKYLTEVPKCIDKKLTTSYRFGSEIAAIANTILFYKEFSPQTSYRKTWIPYRVNGVSSTKGSVLGEGNHFPKGEKYTVIASRNLSLLSFCLEHVLDQSPGTKIALSKESSQKWASIIREIGDLYSLYQGNKNAIKKWRNFMGENIESWDAFTQVIADRDLSQYLRHIVLIEKYQNETPRVVQRFKECVLDKKHSLTDADVILSTVHAAKGMEWDNVMILDDFRGLLPHYQRNVNWEFAIKHWGDDLNLWYVAVTRARMRLILPQTFIRLITSFDILLKYGRTIDDMQPSKANEILRKIRVCDDGNFDMTRASTFNEFKTLHGTLITRWKKEMDSMSTDFDIMDLSTHPSASMKKRSNIEFPEERDEERFAKTIRVSRELTPEVVSTKIVSP